MSISISDLNKIKAIVQNFINEGGLKKSEEDVQSSYTLEILRILGWTSGTWKINAPQEVKTGKKPDIVLKGFGGGSIFVIESKEPQKSLDDKYSQKISFVNQLCNYTNAEGLYWGILTNFVEWRVYNSYTRQIYYNKKYRLIINEKTKPQVNPNDLELLELFNQIEFYSLRAKKGKIDSNPIYYKAEDEIRQEFFSQLKIWRKELRNYLYTQYQDTISADVIDNQTQKILDRLIFTQVCFKKNIISQDILGSVILSERKKFYDELKIKFIELDEKFNSELFANDFCDNFDISNEISENIIKGLNTIDFSNLSVHIIGEVYEDYLGELLKSTKTQIKTDQTKEGKKRKTQGIFYTPENIVDFIIENTLVPKIKECKTIKELEKLRVIDPACGSGSFLIKAYQKFYDAYKSLEEIKRNKMPSFFFEFEVRKKILTQNIFGVDLDERAVEIAKLNLFLKALEGLTISDVPQIKILPNLSLNIRCGNSLVFGNDSENLNFKSKNQLDLFHNEEVDKKDLKKLIELKHQFIEETDLKERAKLLQKIKVEEETIEIDYNEPLTAYFSDIEKIRPFNYNIKFCEIFEDGGFDCVLGNPPWSAKISNSLNSFLSDKYCLESKNLNIFAPFLLLAMKLIKDNGEIGLLIPKVFIKNSSYKTIRENIIKNYSLVKLIDFGKFPGVASDCVAPIISKFKKIKCELIIYDQYKSKVNSVNQNIFSKNPIYAFSPNITEDKVKLIEKIERNTQPLSKISKIRRGIELGQKANITKCTNCNSWNEAGEKYYNETIKKKCKSCGNKLSFEKVICISSTKETKQHTLACLSGKEIDSFLIKDGYFIAPNLKGIDYKEEIFKGDRIYLKRIATKPAGVFLNSKSNYVGFNTIYSLHQISSYDPKFLLGVLNSNLMTFYYDTIYNLGMNLTTQVTIEYLKELPIIKINLKNKEEKNIYDSIINSVDEIQKLMKGNSVSKLKVETIQNNINKKVEKLYHISL